MLNRIRKMLKQQEGFTLVELMIVVVILGIISGIGIQQYGRVQENARIAANDANIRIIRSAAQMWAMSTSEEINNSYDDPTVANLTALVTAGYLESAPVDPWDKGRTEGVYSVGYEETNGIVKINVVYNKDDKAG